MKYPAKFIFTFIGLFLALQGETHEMNPARLSL